MNDPDLRELLHEDPAHLDDVAARIHASLGHAPRLLPSRFALAVEAVAVPLAGSAALVAVVMSMLLRPDAPPPTVQVGAVPVPLAGEPPRAADVYAWMTGLTPTEGDAP